MKIKRSDFTFLKTGHGHYKVTYTSPVTGKMWSSTINDMELIDEVKNADATQAALKRLMRRIKNPIQTFSW